MSLLTNENNVQSLSTHELFDNNTLKTTNNLNVLIDCILSIGDQRLENSQQCKNIFTKNPFQLAFYQILCDIKQKTVLNSQQWPIVDNQRSEEFSRVDNMLMAEGVSEEYSTNNFEEDNCDYQKKLSKIKQIYKYELDKYENHCKDFCKHAQTLLYEQSQIRPITEHEIQRVIMIIKKKFQNIELELKQSTCEAVMILRTRCFDARRKRRNFNKSSTEVLNEYFYSHLSNPYPSDEAKEQLARQCGISVAQVCNWFGNKRIRYKKNLTKTQEEANMYAAKIASQAIHQNRDHISDDY